MIDPETRQYLAAAFDPSQSAESRIARLREMSAMPATAPDMAAPPGLTDPSRGAVAGLIAHGYEPPMSEQVAPAMAAVESQQPDAIAQRQMDADVMTGQASGLPQRDPAPTDADISQAIADAPEPGTDPYGDAFVNGEPIENIIDKTDLELVGLAATPRQGPAGPPQEVVGVNAKLSPVDPGLTPAHHAAEQARAKAEAEHVEYKASADRKVADEERRLANEAAAFDREQAKRRDAMHAEIQRLHAGARKIEDDIAAMPPIGRDRAYAKKGGGGGGFFSLFGRAILGAAVGPEGLDKMSEMAMRKAEHEVALQKAEIANRREQADRAGNMIQRLMATGASMDAAAEKARAIILAQAARDLEEYTGVIRAPEMKAAADAQRAKILADSAKAAANFEAQTGDEIGLSFAQAGRPGTASAMLQEREAARRPAPEPVIEDDLGDLPGPDEGGDIAKIRKLAGMSDMDERVMDAIGTPTGGESVTDEDIMRAIAEAPEPGARQAVSAGVARRRESPVTQAPTFVSDTPDTQEEQQQPRERAPNDIRGRAYDLVQTTFGGDVQKYVKTRDKVQKDYGLQRGGEALALMLGDFRYVSQEQRKQLVTMPNGRRAFVANPNEREKIQGGLSAGAELIANYQRLLKIGETPGHSIDPKMAAEIDLRASENVLILKELKGLGVLTESDIKLIESMTGGRLAKTLSLDAGALNNLRLSIQKLHKLNNAAGMGLRRDPLGRVPWNTAPKSLKKD